MDRYLMLFILIEDVSRFAFYPRKEKEFYSQYYSCLIYGPHDRQITRSLLMR